jgi:hypothetical protein
MIIKEKKFYLTCERSFEEMDDFKKTFQRIDFGKGEDTLR